MCGVAAHNNVMIVSLFFGSVSMDQVTQVAVVEEQLSQLLKERRTLDKEVQGLRNQLARAQEKVCICWLISCLQHLCQLHYTRIA